MLTLYSVSIGCIACLVLSIAAVYAVYRSGVQQRREIEEIVRRTRHEASATLATTRNQRLLIDRLVATIRL